MLAIQLHFQIIVLPYSYRIHLVDCVRGVCSSSLNMYLEDKEIALTVYIMNIQRLKYTRIARNRLLALATSANGIID